MAGAARVLRWCVPDDGRVRPANWAALCEPRLGRPEVDVVSRGTEPARPAGLPDRLVALYGEALSQKRRHGKSPSVNVRERTRVGER
jgi:hypothetical protein